MYQQYHYGYLRTYWADKRKRDVPLQYAEEDGSNQGGILLLAILFGTTSYQGRQFHDALKKSFLTCGGALRPEFFAHSIGAKASGRRIDLRANLWTGSSNPRNTLIDQPWKIMSITQSDWAVVGHNIRIAIIAQIGRRNRSAVQLIPAAVAGVRCNCS
jgi:hypothetical protein